ncbi:MAG: 1-deoxy-D-xylulose-5-phosphate synthase [Candidatus Izemoplasmatales bacterium]
MIDLLEIKDPSFLKELSIKECDELANAIRSFIIEKVSIHGGHLSSNLGVVELTIALHKVYHSPIDKFIFDVGHQSYTHKILTGRAADFDHLREFNGLSGYIKRNESIHDVWEAGHSSTAIAALAGFEQIKVSKHETYKNIAIVGDGSLNSGLSFEALNYLGHQHGMSPLIILNDNEMSISKNVGTLAKLLNSMRSSKTYVQATKTGYLFPKFVRDLKHRIGTMLRGFAKSITIFDELGFSYYGPIDGHNTKQLIKYLESVKKLNKPVVLHVVTKKGKGYLKAEQDQIGLWHGTGPFDITTGELKSKNPENILSWSNIISNHLEHFATVIPDFKVVVPAMITGSALIDFQEKFPDKIEDVGICESFSVCYSAALALGNQQIFIPIYSSFLQRAYDQVLHDVARHRAHVVFGIDRSGLVGEDGETHQGIYDIAFLKHIPQMEIVAPKDAKEAYELLDYAFFETNNPIAIRYSRAKVSTYVDTMFDKINRPSWTKESEGSKGYFIAYGDNVARVKKLVNDHHISIEVVNARFIKPMDETYLQKILTSNLPIIVLEDSVKISGLGSSILEYANLHQLLHSPITILGLPDEFIEQGKVEELLKKYHLDNESLLKLLLKL